MRVLARREPVNRRDARLVVTPRPRRRPRRSSPPRAPHADAAGRTASAARPPTARARRRRRVLGLILLANVATGAVAAFGFIDWLVRRHPGRAAGRLAGRLPADGPPRAGAGHPAPGCPATPRPSAAADRRRPHRRRDRGAPTTSTDADDRPDPGRHRPEPVGPDAGDPPDVRHQAGRRPAHASAPSTSTRPASGPPAAPRPTPDRPRGRRGRRAPNARSRATATAPPAPDPSRFEPAREPGANVSHRLGLWRSW